MHGAFPLPVGPTADFKSVQSAGVSIFHWARRWFIRSHSIIKWQNTLLEWNDRMYHLKKVEQIQCPKIKTSVWFVWALRYRKFLENFCIRICFVGSSVKSFQVLVWHPVFLGASVIHIIVICGRFLQWNRNFSCDLTMAGDVLAVKVWT